MAKLTQEEIKTVALNLRNSIIRYREAQRLNSRSDEENQKIIEKQKEAIKLEIVNNVSDSEIADEIAMLMYNFDQKDRQENNGKSYNCLEAFQHFADGIINGWVR